MTDRAGDVSAVLTIPAETIDATLAHVDCCSRHGDPATKCPPFVLQSRARIRGSRALSGNAAATTGRLAEHAAKVRITRIDGWPLCVRCARTRRRWTRTAATCFWGGLALLLGSIAAAIVAGQSGRLGIPLYIGAMLMLVSPAPFVRGSLPRIIGARTADDGSAVLVYDAHPRFAEQVEGAARVMRTATVDTVGAGE